MSDEAAAIRSGPVQLLAVGFDRPDLSGEVLAEFERLRESDAVRVIDLLVVHKGADGVVRRLEHSELAAGGNEGVGTVVGALIGLDAPLGATREETDRRSPPAEQEFWSLDDAIPDDSAAVIALVEHRWAIGTRDAIRTAGGVLVADAWVHPADLLAAGLTESEDVLDTAPSGVRQRP